MDSEEVLRRLKFWRDTIGTDSGSEDEVLTDAINAIATERRCAEAAEAENERLRKALRPFAEAVDEAGDAETDQMDADAWEHPLAMAVEVGDFHNARAALQSRDEGYG